jgi:hypothetical protein
MEFPCLKKGVITYDSSHLYPDGKPAYEIDHPVFGWEETPRLQYLLLSFLDGTQSAPELGECLTHSCDD